MKIVFTRLDGGLSVVHPVSKEMVMRNLGLSEMTEQDYLDHVWTRSVPPDAINPAWVEDSVIPEDRSMRNGWYFDNANQQILISEQLVDTVTSSIMEKIA